MNSVPHAMHKNVHGTELTTDSSRRFSTVETSLAEVGNVISVVCDYGLHRRHSPLNCIWHNCALN